MNQGCLLSAIFTPLVLDRVLQPLDTLLWNHTKARLDSGNLGDDGMGSITNTFAWVDNVCCAIPLMDLRFTCTTFRELAAPLLLDLNVLKSCILTSADGESIIHQLAEVNPALADKI